MIASLLTDDTLTLENVPHLADVEQLIRILGNHGVDYSVNGRRETPERGLFAHHQFLRPQHRRHHRALRAGVEDAGELLGDRAAARTHGRGEASRCPAAAPSARGRSTCSSTACRRWAPRSTSRTAMSSPRPSAAGSTGNRYVFPKVSVGATHVLMMAATLAKRRDGAGKRRARARGRRPRRLPERHGRPDQRRRHLDDHHRRASTRSPARAHRGHPRPHRDRHLCDGGGDDRRRRHCSKAPGRTCCRPRST